MSVVRVLLQIGSSEVHLGHNLISCFCLVFIVSIVCENRQINSPEILHEFTK